ncbi:MAG: hypothetical protein MJ180_01515 [Candidatus Gastranaerophilales bacterium]|nr:hypothetical protein [Candidatus Gastranaerophilales bacterium]
MPEFSNPFKGNNIENKLTENEIIRAIRFSIASEFEAIQLYEQIQDCTDNKTVKKVLEDIVDEEKVHVGEFLRVLEELTPEEFESYDEGKTEVEDKFL